MDTKFTVHFDDMLGSPKENISNRGISVIRVLKCAWAGRLTLAKEFLGWPVGRIVHPPDKYEPLFGMPAVSVSIEPIIGVKDGVEGYISAKLTVRYENVEYTEVTGPASQPGGTIVYISEALQPCSEFITLSEEKLYWANDQTLPVQATEVPTYLLRMYDWVYTIHNAISIPNDVYTLPGKVNNADVCSRELNLTFAAGTLLCGNPSMERQVTSLGNTAWTITFRFTFKGGGWNNFPRLSDAGSGLLWGPVYASNGTQKYPYETASFGNIVL